MSIATTNRAHAEAVRLERQRTYPRRVLRHVRRLLDWCLNEVELVNLGGGGPCPDVVADLVDQFAEMAGIRVERPADSYAAHDALLMLGGRLLGLDPDLGLA